MSKKKKKKEHMHAEDVAGLLGEELHKSGSFFKRFFHEFKEFAMRGNVISLAVGVIIGGAFQEVVTSLTDNLISPIIGLFTGQNFDALALNIVFNAEKGTGVVLKYGAFITSLINFIITAFVVFLIVRAMNDIMRLGEKNKPEEAPTTKTCCFCCSEVPITATRCPHCTSELEGQELEEGTPG